MTKRLPTTQEIEELVSFLPQLYAEGFTPIKKWSGGNENRDGAVSMPWPEYEKPVEEFFKVASGECWIDHNYHPAETGRMLQDEEAVQTADLAQIKAMLTFCVRGERFCDGHWGSMIRNGHVRRLLQRLAEIARENT